MKETINNIKISVFAKIQSAKQTILNKFLEVRNFFIGKSNQVKASITKKLSSIKNKIDNSVVVRKVITGKLFVVNNSKSAYNFVSPKVAVTYNFVALKINNLMDKTGLNTKIEQAKVVVRKKYGVVSEKISIKVNPLILKLNSVLESINKNAFVAASVVKVKALIAKFRGVASDSSSIASDR